MGFCAGSYEMAIEVVILLSTLFLVCFLVFWFLPSQRNRNPFWWIWLIFTRSSCTAGFIPVQEDERAVIGKQINRIQLKANEHSFSALVSSFEPALEQRN